MHEGIAEAFLPAIGRSWSPAGVEMRCDERALRILSAAAIAELNLRPAAEDDFGREFLAPVAAVKVVDSLDEALEHIYRYGTGHSDAIVTEEISAARRFLDEVDTAVVYVNASTQFHGRRPVRAGGGDHRLHTEDDRPGGRWACARSPRISGSSRAAVRTRA